MTMKKYRIDFDCLEWQALAPGARAKSFVQDGKKIRLLEFTQEFVEPDWCQKGHIGYVISGGLTIDFNGDIQHFNCGDSIFIPSGEAHKHRHHSTLDTVRLFLVEDA